MRYLVGFSADKGGLEALALAKVLARSSKGSLVVCTVIPSGWSHPSPARVDAEYADFLGKHAEKALATAREAVGTEVEADFVARSASSAAEALLATASDVSADYIVLGSARAATTGRFTEGLATTEILHSSTIPIILTPRGYVAPPGLRIQRVTCAISGSENSETIAERAADLAAQFGVDLRMATFIVRDKQMYPTGAGYSVENMVANQFRTQAQSVQDAIRAEWNSNVKLISAVGDGPTWKAALDSLGWEEAELLVVGSSGLGPIARVFLGSSSGKIARYAPVPKVVLPRIAT